MPLLLVVVDIFCLMGVVGSLVGVTVLPGGCMLRDWIIKSTLELTSAWKVSIACIRLLTEVFVTEDRLDVDDVEELEDLLVPDSDVLAFFD